MKPRRGSRLIAGLSAVAVVLSVGGLAPAQETSAPGPPPDASQSTAPPPTAPPSSPDDGSQSAAPAATAPPAAAAPPPAEAGLSNAITPDESAPPPPEPKRAAALENTEEADEAPPPKPPEPPHRPRWPAAILQAVDKGTGQTLRFEAKVDQPVRYKGLTMTVHACETNASDESFQESAAHLEVMSQPQVVAGRKAQPPKSVYTGWMFASSPALHPLEHPLYDLWLIACRTDAPSAPGASA